MTRGEWCKGPKAMNGARVFCCIFLRVLWSTRRLTIPIDYTQLQIIQCGPKNPALNGVITPRSRVKFHPIGAHLFAIDRGFNSIYKW